MESSALSVDEAPVPDGPPVFEPVWSPSVVDLAAAAVVAAELENEPVSTVAAMR